MSETAFTRVSRIRLLALEEEGDKRARRVVAPARTSRADAEQHPVARPRVPDDRRDAARHRARADARRAGVARRHRDRDLRGVHAVRSRAEDVRAAAQRALGARVVAAARVRHELLAAARADPRVHRARQRRAAGQGIAARAVRHRGRDPHDGRRRRAGGRDRDRGARADPLDLRVRRHRRARGDAAAHRHGRGRSRRHRRRGDRHRDRRRASRGCPRTTRQHRQHRRTRVPEGPRRAQRERRGERAGAPEPAAPRTSCRSRSASPSCCARCRPRSSTWRSSSTSTAAPPGSSRWRTCSRRSSARSPTSTTSTSRPSSGCRTARCAFPGRTPIDEVNELLDVELPDEEWDTVGGLVFNALGHVPDRGRVLHRSTGSSSAPNACRVARIVSVIITRVGPVAAEARRPSAASDVPVGIRRRSSAGPTSGSRRCRTSSSGRRSRSSPTGRRRRARRSAACAPPTRRRSCSSTRPACTSRARCSASAPTSGRSRRWPRSTCVCFLIEATDPIGRGDRFVAERLAAVAHAGRARGNKVDVAGPRRRSREHLAIVGRRAGRLRGVRAALGAHRRAAPTRCSASSKPGCPRVRTTTPTASSAISPNRSSPPSCVREQLLADRARRAAALDRGHDRGDRGAAKPRRVRARAARGRAGRARLTERAS